MSAVHAWLMLVWACLRPVICKDCDAGSLVCGFVINISCVQLWHVSVLCADASCLMCLDSCLAAGLFICAGAAPGCAASLFGAN